MNTKSHAFSLRWSSCLLGFGLVSGAACSSAPSVPAQPTWADVAPILHGECAGCHGSTALETGGGYRLDFYEMTSDVCGDAARAIPPGMILAGTSAPLITVDVTPPAGEGRPRMPPAPAPALLGWERLTLQRWAAQPTKGPPPPGNHPPTIDVGRLPASADKRLTFTAVLDDADGEPVVGVIEVAGLLYAMNRAGAFDVDLDSSTWPEGTQRLSAVLCDGWTKVTYDLGPVSISH